jgi:hypothetical protein
MGSLVFLGLMRKPKDLPQANELSDDQLDPIVGGLSSSRPQLSKEEGERMILERFRAAGMNATQDNFKNPNSFTTLLNGRR